MKKSVLFFSLIAIYTLIFAQGEDIRKKPAHVFDNPRNEQSFHSNLPTPKANLPGTSPINWQIIDSMGNIYSFYSNEVTPFYYDPDLNIYTFVHRGDWTSYTPPFFTGLLYYNWSTDEGLTWQRSNPINNIDYPEYPRAHYPSGAIFNPTNNINDAIFYSVYPNLIWGLYPYVDIGFSGDYPIMSNTNFTIHIRPDTSWEWPFLPIPTWISKQYIFWVGKCIGYDDNFCGIYLFRTPDSINIEQYQPTTWDTSGQLVTHLVSLNGDAIQVGSITVMAYGCIGHFRQNAGHSTTYLTRAIGITYSTDEGTSWTLWDTVNLNQVSGLGDYRTIWSWTGSNYRVSGRMCLDSMGYPHVVTGLQKNHSGAGTDVVIAEIYKDHHDNQWKGKIISPANSSSKWITTDPRVAYSAQITRNKEGNVFVAHFVNGVHPTNNVDIFVSGRNWRSAYWTQVHNITQTPYINEWISQQCIGVKHLGGDIYRTYISYAHPSSDPLSSPNRTYIMVGYYDICMSTFCLPIVRSEFIYPPVYYSVTPDSCFNYFLFKVRSAPTEPITDSFYVEYSILNSSLVELYKSVKQEPPMNSDEERLIEFPGPWCPPDTGLYYINFTVFSESICPDPDRISGALRVIKPGSITYATIEKRAIPYQEITDGVSLLMARTTNNISIYDIDDGWYYMALPFKFNYNGEIYDSIIICVNGWVSFGKEGYKRDSLPYGLPVPNSIGFNENRRLYYTNPRKAISPWWEDLSLKKAPPQVNDDGDISVKTIGSSPERVFIIQWKNVNAYYDTIQTNTRINFQLRLYEKHNEIEFCYGPVIPGTFSGIDTGAMIGLKDIEGGYYHYVDIGLWEKSNYQKKTGNSCDEITFLNPLNDWPGNGIRYWISQERSLPSYYKYRGWNLISLPGKLEDSSVSAIFQNAIPNTTYEYVPEIGYQKRDTLTRGKGYWTKFSTDGLQYLPITILFKNIEIPLKTGWNLIGSIGYPVPAVSWGIIISPVFGYKNGYYITSTIKPSEGYFVKSMSNESIVLSFENQFKCDNSKFDEFTSITFTDNHGGNQTLYITESKDDINPDYYEMPPSPPSDLFDIRFSSNRILEVYRSAELPSTEYPIHFQGIKYPIVLEYSIKDERVGIILSEKDENGHELSVHSLNGNGIISIKSPAKQLSLKVIEGKSTPDEFALGNNYPNPFNPNTTITYHLPTQANVTITIYGLLGQKIRTLLNEVKPAGYHTIEWNGKDERGIEVPSGLYIIQMKCENFRITRKVLLIR